MLKLPTVRQQANRPNERECNTDWYSLLTSGGTWGERMKKSRRYLLALVHAIAAGSITVACGGGSQESGNELPGDSGPEVAESAPVSSDELGPPTGPEMIVGLVNSEGSPGLDFPDIRRFIEAAVAYTNEHGGFGNRPITLETCIAKGSPETSQACAQELVGKNAELVLLGFDLFPDYKTYAAADVPVIGVLPILAPDYTADALFVTGGNVTSQAAIASVAKEHFQAASASIIHADNPGSNSTAASLQAALDKAGITWTAVKGGDNETDAGYQGLMREAASSDPDVIVSLYAEAGCIGAMRGRALLGIQIPVITTAACADKDVIDQVGDDATGWMFAGLAEDVATPERNLQRRLLAPVLGVDESELTTASYGLGGLGYLMYMSLVEATQKMLDSGLEVTGRSLYDYMKGGNGLTLFGSDNPLECGVVAAYPAVCSFVFPFAEYKGGGVIGPVDGLGLVDSKTYLP